MPRPPVLAITLFLGMGLLVSAGGQQPIGRGAPRKVARDTDCSFLRDPQRYLFDRDVQNRVRTSAMEGVVRSALSIDRQEVVPDASAVPRRNFIDDEIFTRMAAANIRPAAISGDAEFLRRVTLDLTGHIPSPTTVTSFLADTNPNKRDAMIDSLIGSLEYSDKWTMFFGDLFQNDFINSQNQRGFDGRDQFYLYIRNSIRQNKPYNLMAYEMITATGDNWLSGPPNWPLGNVIFAGPIQDTYDGGAVKIGSHFLGIGSVDCLLCHDGARHLDQINLWGSTQKRRDLWGLSAFFSRTSMYPITGSGSMVTDITTGGYELNTDWGNRVTRAPVGGVTVIEPRYPFTVNGGGIAEGESYRQALAREVIGDLQFARATVNYVWEKIMVEALVSPSNGFDLARLDPSKPPPAPWTLQPTNPQLLDRLARDFQQNGFNLRLLIGTIVKSNAYQLSSTYPGRWEPRFVPYYARKYVRRLDAEELLDALNTAAGNSDTYTIQLPTKLPRVVNWAMQLPDVTEPRANSGAVSFLTTFGRGDRDQNPRRSDSSIQQALLMMNNYTVTSRTDRRLGYRVTQLLAGSSNPEYLIRQLFLYTLSRPVTDDELAALLPLFQQQGTTVATENLQWSLFNRLQFLFNY